MPSILEAGTKATLDSVAKNKLRAEADLKGNIEGALSTTRRQLTFTMYVSALVRGPKKSVTGGIRVERDF